MDFQGSYLFSHKTKLFNVWMRRIVCLYFRSANEREAVQFWKFEATACIYLFKALWVIHF